MDVDIFCGGLTRVGQYHEKMINKVFKGFPRDLYNHYMITVKFIPSGNPEPPTRHILVTWVVKAWDMVSEELVRKYSTSCGCPPEDMLGKLTKRQLSIQPQTN